MPGEVKAIGLVEFNSIGRGMEATDAMVKVARVTLLSARCICPGKFMALVAGDVAAVKSSVEAGLEAGKETVVDSFVLPHVHPGVIPAIAGGADLPEVRALGLIETFSVASLVVAADAAAKAAMVELLEIRLAVGLGGKSYVTMTGDVGAVKAAVGAGVAAVAEGGLLVSQVVIPAPSRDLVEALL